MNSLTKLFQNLLEFHVELRETGREPEWFIENREQEIWVQEVPNKSSLDFLVELWNQANEDLGSDDEFRSFYDSDGVETEDVEVLAYYRTFRSIEKGRRHQDWGIHFNVGNFFAFVRRIAKSAGVDGLAVLPACYYFVFQHEVNHYEVDLGIFFLEAHSGKRGYFNRTTPNLLEEALGNGRGATHAKVKKYKKFIVHRYAHSSLPGYNQLQDYLTPKRQRDAFNEILFDCIRPANSQEVPLAHEFMKLGQPFSPSQIPIYFHIGIGGDISKPSVPQNFQYVVNVITYSESGKREIAKLTKKDAQLREKIERVHKKIIENPNSNGNRLRKFHGSRGMIEARIDGGMRMLMQDRGNGAYEVIHIGNDLYDH